MGAYTPIPRVEVTLSKLDKPWKGEEFTFSEKIRNLITPKVDSCFLCAWILKDFMKNGKLTNSPLDYSGQPIFPRVGKEEHLKIEGLKLEES